MDKLDVKPIVYKNIYYILMYAIDELRGAKLRDIDIERVRALNDLYASILNTSMRYVINSGVLQEYNELYDVTDKPKGKINIAKSITSNNYQKGLINCRYFRLNIDNDVNRVIKLAIKILLGHRNSIEKKSVSNLKMLVSFLSKVKDVLPNEVSFGDIDTKQLSVEYKTAFYMSKLIIEEFITKEDGSNRRIIEMEDKERMHRVFELFIRNYYVIHYKRRGITIGPKQFGVTETANTHFGKSITDITVENKQNNRVMIVDTKWYKEVLNKHNKFHSANVTQIKDYVRDYKEDYGNEDTFITGILLYAKPSTDIDVEAVEEDKMLLPKKGMLKYGQVRTKIIDLTQNFDDIKEKLNSIFEEYVN